MDKLALKSGVTLELNWFGYKNIWCVTNHSKMQDVKEDCNKEGGPATDLLYFIIKNLLWSARWAKNVVRRTENLSRDVIFAEMVIFLCYCLYEFDSLISILVSLIFSSLWVLKS